MRSQQFDPDRQGLTSRRALALPHKVPSSHQGDNRGHRGHPSAVCGAPDEAEKKDPGLLDRVGSIYAQHPDVFKALGGSVLAIALGQMARRVK